MWPLPIGPSVQLILLDTHGSAHLQDLSPILAAYNPRIIIRVIWPALQVPAQINRITHTAALTMSLSAGYSIRTVPANRAVCHPPASAASLLVVPARKS